MVVIGHKTFLRRYRTKTFLFLANQIQIRIQESQINADPCGFGSTTLFQDADIILIVVL
jgi:hypothetical protein